MKSQAVDPRGQAAACWPGATSPQAPQATRETTEWEDCRRFSCSLALAPLPIDLHLLCSAATPVWIICPLTSNRVVRYASTPRWALNPQREMRAESKEGSQPPSLLALSVPGRRACSCY